ncbi:MAG: hypothetical protein JSV41_02215, partial [Gemmatimonadota bacterium]
NVDAATANLLGVAPEDLVQVSVPFRVVNLTNDPATEVQLAMLASTKEASQRDSITLGSGLVTLRAAVPADVWVPEEPLIFIETLQDVPLRGVYDGTEYYLQDGGGNLIIGDTTVVTWTDVLLGCAEPATGCNPIAGDVATPGATGHIPFTANQALEIEFLNPFTSLTRYVFAIDPAVAGIDVTEVSDSAIAEIKVVPNPYVVWSEFEQLGNQNPRLMFTGLPPRGTITIFTVSGQFVQRISYDEDDLMGLGDLFWDMRSREGNDIASGLYIFVLEGEYDFQDVGGVLQPQRRLKKLGKFVVIR